MADRTVGFRCPEHYIELQNETYYGLNVWFCPQCDLYYIPQQKSHINSSTLNGKQIKSAPLHTLENNSEVHSEVKQIKKAFNFSEQYSRLTKCFDKLICPVHRKLLDMRVAHIQLDDSKSEPTTIGYCKICDALYSNDTHIAFCGEISFWDKPLIWSPFKLPPYCKVKSNMRVKPNITVKINTTELNIVSSKNAIQSCRSSLIANAIAQVPLKSGKQRKICGYYVSQEKKFYTTPAFVLEDLLPQEISELMLNDPKGKMKSYMDSNEGKVRISVLSKRRNYQEYSSSPIRNNKTNEAWIKGDDYFTQPLLKGDDTKCPFCKGLLTKEHKINMVVYEEGKAVGRYRTPSLFCEKCKVPFISLKQEIAAINHLSPKKIYVFDARTCSDAKDLMKKATDRLINRPTKAIRTEDTLPFSNELAEGAPLPNISYCLEQSTVLVYAHTCHCHACEKKYKQNTIRDRAAMVQTLAGKTAKINVQFCAGCGRYFMNIISFKQYCKMYGAILIECSMDKALLSQNSTWLNFAPDSILSRCGYSVKKGIPKIHRQAILAYILDSRKASKYEVIEIISNFIRFRQSHLHEACERWREDIQFVNEYKIQSQEVVNGLKFQKAGTYRFDG